MLDSADFSLLGSTDPALNRVLSSIASICADIKDRIAGAAHVGELGLAGQDNVQGEAQKALDVIANDLFVESLLAHPDVAGLASEEMDDALWAEHDGGELLVVFDPLDGSSNIDVNVSVGSIFSILRVPANSTHDAAAFLQRGRDQLAAGYAVYGPATQLVLSTGSGTVGFSWHTGQQKFAPVTSQYRLSQAANEYAINASNQRYWDAPIQQYIADCNLGETGPRGKNFNMRWVASMVAEIHRILTRGGVFLYPHDSRMPEGHGKLRLLYEANPMAMLIEQAGGDSSTGIQKIMDIEPTALHQRVPVITGACEEVTKVESMYRQGS
ncbi:MAG: class 1 fructose-bisphosphatase [Gammaproteobacteria bacterium]|nr:class 1 fructose-bisphosphatase [Gammaproteobacteria bacterium]